MAFADGAGAQRRTVAARARRVVDVAHSGARLARHRRRRRRAGGGHPRGLSRRARRGHAGRRARCPVAPPPRWRRRPRAARCACSSCDGGSGTARWSARPRARAKPVRRSSIVHAAAGDASALRAADVIVATRWPTFGRPLIAALLGAAAGKAVIVAETESTATVAGARPADLAAAIARRGPRRAGAADGDLDRPARRGALADAGARAAGGRRGAARGAGRRRAGVVGSGTRPCAHAVAAWRDLARRGGHAAAVPPRPAALARAPRCRRRRDDARDPGSVRDRES